MVSSMLVGCGLNKISYYITGWDLRFIGKTGPEYSVYASDLEIPNYENWWESVRAMPVDLSDTNEPNDTIAAIVLFTALNKWPVNDVAIDDQGNLCLTFENGSSFKALANVEFVDWTWQIDSEAGNVITCDSGVLYSNA